MKSNHNFDALNLCTFGDMLLVDDLWLLERYLKSHAPPKRIVLVHVYDVWHRETPRYEALRQIPMQWNEWSELTALIPLDLSWRISTYIDQWCPLYSRRDTLYQMLIGWTEPTIKLKQIFTPRGFRVVENASPDKTNADLDRHMTFLSDSTFSPSELNVLALQKIQQLCDKNSIKLYIFNSPLDQRLLESPEFSNYNRNLVNWLLVTSVNHPNIQICTEVFGVVSDELETLDHVTLPAAIRYTDFIGDFITTHE